MGGVTFYKKSGKCGKCGQQLYVVTRRGGKPVPRSGKFHMRKCSRAVSAKINATRVGLGLLPIWIPVDNEEVKWLRKVSKIYNPQAKKRFREITKKLRRLDEAEWLLQGCLEQLTAMNCSAAHAVSWVHPRATVTTERVQMLKEFLSNEVSEDKEMTCLPKKS